MPPGKRMPFPDVNARSPHIVSPVDRTQGWPPREHPSCGSETALTGAANDCRPRTDKINSVPMPPTIWLVFWATAYTTFAARSQRTPRRRLWQKVSMHSIYLSPARFAPLRIDLNSAKSTPRYEPWTSVSTDRGRVLACFVPNGSSPFSASRDAPRPPLWANRRMHFRRPPARELIHSLTDRAA